VCVALQKNRWVERDRLLPPEVPHDARDLVSVDGDELVDVVSGDQLGVIGQKNRLGVPSKQSTQRPTIFTRGYRKEGIGVGAKAVGLLDLVDDDDGRAPGDWGLHRPHQQDQ